MTEIQDDRRGWYQKKRYLIPAGILALTLVFSGADEPQHTTETYYVALQHSKLHPPNKIS